MAARKPLPGQAEFDWDRAERPEPVASPSPRKQGKLWLRIDSVIESDVCAAYRAGEKCDAVAARLGISKVSVYHILNRNGIKLDRYRKVTPDQAIKAAEAYVEGITMAALAQARGCSHATMRLAVAGTGLRIKTISEAKRTKTLREDAFDEITPESAYWVGFLMADGCITQSTNNYRTYVNLALAPRDESHIEKFRSFLGSNHKLSYCRPAGFAGSTGTVGLYVASRPLASALARFGVLPRKSTRERVSILENDRDFWRGMIDGDGYFTFTLEKGSGKRYPLIGLVGGETIVSQFESFANAICPHSKANRHPMNGIWSIVYAGENAVQLTRALYADCVVSLDRKHLIAQEILTNPYTCKKPRRHDLTLEIIDESIVRLGSLKMAALAFGVSPNALASRRYKLRKPNNTIG